jgi:hypothetical protein
MTHGFPCRRPAHSVYVFGFSRGAYTARARWHALASGTDAAGLREPAALRRRKIHHQWGFQTRRLCGISGGGPIHQGDRRVAGQSVGKLARTLEDDGVLEVVVQNSTTCTSPLAASVEKVRTCSSRLRFQAAAVGCGNRSTRNVPDAGRPRWIQGGCSTCWVIRSPNVARSTRSCAQWLPAT